MSEEELKQYYGQLTDCWKLMRKYSGMENTDEYWQNFIDESCQIAKAHGNGKFIRGLLMAVSSEFERRVREVRAK